MYRWQNKLLWQCAAPSAARHLPLVSYKSPGTGDHAGVPPWSPGSPVSSHTGGMTALLVVSNSSDTPGPARTTAHKLHYSLNSIRFSTKRIKGLWYSPILLQISDISLFFLKVKQYERKRRRDIHKTNYTHQKIECKSNCLLREMEIFLTKLYFNNIGSFEKLFQESISTLIGIVILGRPLISKIYCI